MKLEKSEVEHIGVLSHIELTETEKEKYTQELGEIINYVDELDNAPTDPSRFGDRAEVEQISGLENISRDDEIKPSLSNSEALQNAPEKKDGFIKVKKIFE